MALGIGIDTGGTYTDAVAYDFDSKSILGSAKALTTKEDLSLGILNALDGLPDELLKKAEILSLSTTLATNACVENRGGRAKLIFFGGNAKVIDELGGKYGLPPSEEILLQESFTTFSGDAEREPDWELFKKLLKDGFEQLDGVGIIEMNAMKNGAVIEKKAKALFQERYDIPVVCGHELFSELNCLQRGSSTLLNAGLFPIIKEFLEAVKAAARKRGINASLVIVRSDGSMMSEEFAAVRPVETLLCGPAASAMGGLRLCGESSSVIVDMGGTTTDIALVKNGVPVTVVDGVSIGKWKTFVDGLYIKTLGLGGDSAVHYTEDRLRLEDYRITPLCVAAQKHPAVLENLRLLLDNRAKHTKFLYEHYMLIRDIGENPSYTDFERRFCGALSEGPLPIRAAAQAVGTDIYNLDVSRLLGDGVVQLCGLTPTDIMHIKGDFDAYCAEASLLGAEFAAFNLDMTVGELCDAVYGEIKRKLYVNIVAAMLENKYPRYMKHGVGGEVERLINESYEAARTGNDGGFIGMMFSTGFSLVGIGAPIRIFLEDVAKTLNTRAVIPEHFEVANALGAIAGSVSAVCAVEIRPSNSLEGGAGYIVFGKTGNKAFEAIEDAEEFAALEAAEGAKKEARSRGARGDVAVICRTSRNDAQARDCTIYLGTTVTARATGAVRF